MVDIFVNRRIKPGYLDYLTKYKPPVTVQSARALKLVTTIRPAGDQRKLDSTLVIPTHTD